MRWVLKVIAGDIRALIAVPLFAAFMVLTVGAALAEHYTRFGDSSPVGGTEEHEIQIIVASMPAKVDTKSVASVCNATVSIEVFDVKKLGSAPVAALTKVSLSAGASLRLIHVFAPQGPEKRQDVVVRVTLTPDVTGTTIAAYTSICSHVGSTQTIVTATGASIGLIPLLMIGQATVE